MKTFREYLAESEKTYSFRIKLADMPDDEFISCLENCLERYELRSISKPIRTPIQEHPVDFQLLNNVDVYIIDVILAYPVTAHQLYEYLGTESGIPLSHIVVINRSDPEDIAREKEVQELEQPYTSKLNDPDYTDAEKINSKDFFGDEYNANFLKSLTTRKYEFATKE